MEEKKAEKELVPSMVPERDNAIARLRHISDGLRKRADEMDLLSDFLVELDRAGQLPDEVERILWKIALNLN